MMFNIFIENIFLKENKKKSKLKFYYSSLLCIKWIIGAICVFKNYYLLFVSCHILS